MFLDPKVMRELDPRLTTISVSANIGMALILPKLVVNRAPGIYF